MAKSSSSLKGIALVADEHFSGYKKGDVFTLESAPRNIAQKALEAYGTNGNVQPGRIHQFASSNQNDIDLLEKHTPGTNVREGAVDLEGFEIENA